TICGSNSSESDDKYPTDSLWPGVLPALEDEEAPAGRFRLSLPPPLLLILRFLCRRFGVGSPPTASTGYGQLGTAESPAEVKLPELAGSKCYKGKAYRRKETGVTEQSRWVGTDDYVCLFVSEKPAGRDGEMRTKMNFQPVGKIITLNAGESTSRAGTSQPQQAKFIGSSGRSPYLVLANCCVGAAASGKTGEFRAPAFYAFRPRSPSVGGRADRDWGGGFLPPRPAAVFVLRTRKRTVTDERRAAWATGEVGGGGGTGRIGARRKEGGGGGMGRAGGSERREGGVAGGRAGVCGLAGLSVVIARPRALCSDPAEVPFRARATRIALRNEFSVQPEKPQYDGSGQVGRRAGVSDTKYSFDFNCFFYFSLFPTKIHLRQRCTRRDLRCLPASKVCQDTPSSGPPKPRIATTEKIHAREGRGGERERDHDGGQLRKISPPL
ncbi:MAG: hypothetical protein BJ554DRAFT_4594, partial [Olpidium bornovanus]